MVCSAGLWSHDFYREQKRERLSPLGDRKINKIIPISNDHELLCQSHEQTFGDFDMTHANFEGGEFRNKVDGFSSPTQRPPTDELRRRWQEANRNWWSSTPMRY